MQRRLSAGRPRGSMMKSRDKGRAVRRYVVPFAAAAFFLASCSDVTPASTSTTGADGASEADVTVTTLTTETSTVAPEPSITSSAVEPSDSASTTAPLPAPTRFVPPDPFVSPVPTAAGGGSGCTPGSGELPDGVWFGFVDGVTEATLDFDLACFESCDAGSGVRIGNQNPGSRTVPVLRDAQVISEALAGPDWQDSFESWRRFEDVGLHTMVWIYVNDGDVTHIVQPAVAEGCRFSAVTVDWVNQLAPAGRIAFNELGLIATAPHGADQNLFYWRASGWRDAASLDGTGDSGWEGSTVAASGSSVGIGGHVYRWTGGSWSTETFDALGGEVYALSASGDRVLMSGMADDDAVVYVATWVGNGWSVEMITIGHRSDWETWAGALSGDTFAVSDTGLHTAQGAGTVRLYDWDGTSWTLTFTLQDQWDTGMWGSSLDLDGNRLLVGADGSTPGPGSRGGAYLYTRTHDGWTPQIVGQGSEGFGFGSRIDGDTIVTAAAHGDAAATFWVFTPSAEGWNGTPILLDTRDAGEVDDWVYGLDVYGDDVAVSIREGVRIGTLRLTND